MLTKKRICLIIIGVILLVGWSSGKFLDQQAEMQVETLYTHDNQGVIKGLESIVINHSSSTALLLLHGFGSSPVVFDEMIAATKDKPMDIYAPLLPYHGRNLSIFAQLNNEKVIQFVAENIQKLSQRYKHVTVLGFSYSGAVLIELLKRKLIPNDVQVILYAPAIYIKSNNTQGDVLLDTYSLWRDYCNYAVLGCNTRSYASGDSSTKQFSESEKTLGYVVTPAVKQLYKLDDATRDYLTYIKSPFNLIMARDDDRVSYVEVAKACNAIHNCKLNTFPSGRHYLLLGKYKKEFNDLVIQIVTKHSAL